MGWSFRLALGILLKSGLTFAYPTPIDFDGSLQRWDISDTSPVVTYEVLSDSEEEIHASLVDAAAQLWTDVPSSYLVLERAEEGEVPQITVNARDQLEGAPYSAGYAVFDEKDNNGNPVHCTIEVSSAMDLGFTVFAKTVLHEFGHCVGLGHSLIPQAIMSYELENNDFQLDTDDAAAVSRLYPADGSHPELPLGCGIGGQIQHNRFPVLLLLLFPILVVLAVVTRERVFWPAP